MTPRGDHVDLRISADGSPDVDRLRERARRAFDLDADPEAIDAALSRDPKLAPLIARTPGIRVPGTFDGFELLVRAIFGQQVSVAGARTSLGRLVTAAGTPLERPTAGITHLFPTAEQVAELPPEAFGMPRARAETIRSVAELVAQDELDLSGDSSSEEALARLGDVPGIGPWTLSYVADACAPRPGRVHGWRPRRSQGLRSTRSRVHAEGDARPSRRMATLARVRRHASLAPPRVNLPRQLTAYNG